MKIETYILVFCLVFSEKNAFLIGNRLHVSNLIINKWKNVDYPLQFIVHSKSAFAFCLFNLGHSLIKKKKKKKTPHEME